METSHLQRASRPGVGVGRPCQVRSNAPNSTRLSDRGSILSQQKTATRQDKARIVDEAQAIDRSNSAHHKEQWWALSVDGFCSLLLKQQHRRLILRSVLPGLDSGPAQAQQTLAELG